MVHYSSVKVKAAIDKFLNVRDLLVSDPSLNTEPMPLFKRGYLFDLEDKHTFQEKIRALV